MFPSGGGNLFSGFMDKGDIPKLDIFSSGQSSMF
jgi:hypothetical protein